MKSRRPSCALAVLFAGFLCSASGLWAQIPISSGHIGAPQDWSHNKIVFSRDGLEQHPEILDQEPRVLQQVMRRFQVPGDNIFVGVDPLLSSSTSAYRRDWNVSLGKGHVATNMFPAKFSFDPGAPPSCANDYVVFGLATGGVTKGQANLVAFNNLYSGTGGYCGAAPTVYFAYNVSSVAGGRVLTSPVISEDGTKIAFVESLGTSAIFHVLTFTAGQGSISAAAAPGSAMSSLTFSTSNVSLSSPWVDYASDFAYIGSDNGNVYKFTGVFKGTPALAGSPWPIKISTLALSPPVLDNRLGMLMVGSRDGNLYQINISNGAVATLVVGATGGTSPGVIAAPIVDVTNGTTFVVSANDGTSGVVVEADTSTLAQLAKGRIGIAAKSHFAITLYEPAFSNNYFNNPSTGTLDLCGTGAADLTPWHYSFGFTGRTMQTVPTGTQLLTSTLARCTGWTEFYNPNIGGGTDYFFFGLTRDCTGPTTSGCVVEIANEGSPLMVNITGGPSGIIVDNYSTKAQASSIYFTAESVNTAYKLTQNGLQ